MGSATPPTSTPLGPRSRRRLWRQLCEDQNLTDVEINKQGDIDLICNHFLGRNKARDAEDEALGRALRRIPPAPAVANVHDVHPNFPRVHIPPPPPPDPPPGAGADPSAAARGPG